MPKITLWFTLMTIAQIFGVMMMLFFYAAMGIGLDCSLRPESCEGLFFKLPYLIIILMIIGDILLFKKIQLSNERGFSLGWRIIRIFLITISILPIIIILLILLIISI